MSISQMTKPCPQCKGRGRVPDPAKIGRVMRRTREKTGVSLREVARRMKIAAPTLSDMELGKRPWKRKSLDNYFAALKPQAK